MKIFADLLGGILHIIVMYLFYKSFLPQYNTKKQFVIAVYVLTGIYGIAYPIFVLKTPMRMLCTLIYFALPLVVHRDKLAKKVMLVAVYFIVLNISELMLNAILLGYLGDFMVFYQSFEYYYFWGVIFSWLLTTIILYIFSTSVILLQNRLPVYLYAVLFLMPAFSVVLFFYLQEIVILVNEQSVYNAYCLVTLILLLFNLFVIFTVSRISQASELKARLAYEESRTQDQHRYHQNLAVYHQKVRQLSHDLHNHLLILHHALQEKDYSTAEQYVEKQLTILDGSKTIYTGYLLLDTILDYKQQIARNKQIRMQIQSALDPDMPLTEELLQDWCIMLGSCLDNAIEATEQIAEVEQRKIKVSIKYDAFYLSCCIENNVQAPVPVAEQQIPQTAKSDKTLHGLGLQNVKRLAEQHDGYLVLECSETVFTTRFTAKYR